MHKLPKNPSAASPVWRSVNAAGSPQEKQGIPQSEFEPGDSEFAVLERRDMLKLMGASLALAGVGSACRRPEDKLLPYTHPPENITPGIPNHFATVQPHADGAVGLIVKSHEGRPTKVEGNPQHPASLGAAGVWEQASVLQLYDPDRSRTPLRREHIGLTPATWAMWDAFATEHFAALAETKGKGLAFLCGAHTSPTQHRLQQALEKRFPQATHHTWDLLDSHTSRLSTEIAYGPDVRFLPQLDQAQVIFTLQGDPLGFGSDKLRLARDFAKGRRISSAKQTLSMNRLYVAEAAYTITGANADHRLPLSMIDSGFVLLLLISELIDTHKLSGPWDQFSIGFVQQARNLKKYPHHYRVWDNLKAHSSQFVKALAQDLMANRGRCLLLPGESLHSFEHLVMHTLNVALNDPQCKTKAKTFRLLQPPSPTRFAKPYDFNNSFTDSGTALLRRLNTNAVNTLVVLDCNPAYTNPEGADFAKALGKAKYVIHAGLYADETAQHAHWHLPMAHFLETWTDALSSDGTPSIGQPLIEPLHKARSCHQLLAQIATSTVTKAQDLVRQTWLGLGNPLTTEKQWRRAVHDGVIAPTHFAYEELKAPALDPKAVKGIYLNTKRINIPSKDNLEVIFMPSYSVGDGRLANLAWLQELPDPITKLTWGNALLVSPALAKEMNIRSQTRGRLYQADVVRLKLGDRFIEIPAFVLPGLPPYSVVAPLGYGRTHAGTVGNGVGVKVHPLLGQYGNYPEIGGRITLLGRTQALACTQEQFAMNAAKVRQGATLSLSDRDPTRHATLDYYRKHPTYVKAKEPPASLKHTEQEGPRLLQMHKSWKYTGNKWGMVIDLAACIGCGACVTACQAENNIPVVGAQQVMRGRILHWIRVDRYYSGPVENPRAIHQPIVCMHCENAPCEPVCPVAATTHDSEGLNVMTYNRCIGTRYCGNNCPYKVRRFNYLDYTNTGNMHVAADKKRRQQLTALQHNPDVTVRYRGVMEKCTYCTQRIQQAKHKARLEKRDPHALRDGDVTPACAQTCPTQAITFGNLNDPKSAVAALKKVDRNYQLLSELNTRPRTSYLSRLHNPLRGAASGFASRASGKLETSR